MYRNNDSRQSLYAIPLERLAILSRSRSDEATKASRNPQISDLDERGHRASYRRDDPKDRARQTRASASDRDNLRRKCGNAIAWHRAETQARSARRTRIRNRLWRLVVRRPRIDDIVRSRNATTESSRDSRSSRSRRSSLESFATIKRANRERRMKRIKRVREIAQASRSKFSRESSAAILRIWGRAGAAVAWLALLLLRFTRALVNRQWRKSGF